MPCGVRGFGVVAGRFGGRDFAPAAHTVGDDFDKDNAAVVGETPKLVSNGAFSTHLDFTQSNGFNLRKAQEVSPLFFVELKSGSGAAHMAMSAKELFARAGLNFFRRLRIVAADGANSSGDRNPFAMLD